MASLLIGLGIAALCIAALRIAKPEHYSPRCCMGLALQTIRDAEEKDKRSGTDGARQRPEGESSGKA
jgi:hypothetical protein